jgi:hypothetical protein
MKTIVSKWIAQNIDRGLYVGNDDVIYSNNRIDALHFDSKEEAEIYLAESVLPNDTKDAVTGKILDIEYLNDKERHNCQAILMEENEFDIFEIVLITEVLTKAEYRKQKIENVIERG